MDHAGARTAIKSRVHPKPSASTTSAAPSGQHESAAQPHLDTLLSRCRAVDLLPASILNPDAPKGYFSRTFGQPDTDPSGYVDGVMSKLSALMLHSKKPSIGGFVLSVHSGGGPKAMTATTKIQTDNRSVLR